jgi:hypothetical protein
MLLKDGRKRAQRKNRKGSPCPEERERREKPRKEGEQHVL